MTTCIIAEKPSVARDISRIVGATSKQDRYIRCLWSAYTIMLNLNRSWIQKQGDFFVESPIILLVAII